MAAPWHVFLNFREDDGNIFEIIVVLNAAFAFAVYRQVAQIIVGLLVFQFPQAPALTPVKGAHAEEVEKEHHHCAAGNGNTRKRPGVM